MKANMGTLRGKRIKGGLRKTNFFRNAVNKERKTTTQGWEANDNAELQKEIFRGPRDALLILCSMFIEDAGPRLKELAKLAAPLEHIKIPDLLDHRCHVVRSVASLKNHFFRS